MRSFVSWRACLAAGALGGLLLVAGGCSSGGGTASVAADSKPVTGGTLTFAADTEPVSWDVHVTTQDITAEIERNVVDSLVSEDSSGTFHPWLATSWSVSPNLETYTFHLRHGVRFTDGTPFNAEAVKANFDYTVAPSTKSLYAASLLGPYIGTKVVNTYTVEVEFSKPFAPFLQAAGTPYLGFYSPRTLTENAGKLGEGGPVDVGTGPFIFASYVQGQQAVFTRNPDYDGGPATADHSGPAYLSKLVVRFLTDPSVRLGALTSGQVQVANAIAPEDVATVRADPDLTLLTRDEAGGNYDLWLNASLAPLNDQRVREAVQRGINITADVKTVDFGQYPRAWSPISPTTPYYDASLVNSWPYDPALANKLLDEAGWTGRDAQGYRTKDGKPLVLQWPQIPAIATEQNRDILGQAIQADLKKIGIQVVRPSLNVAAFGEKVYAGQEDMIDHSWPTFDPDVLWLFFNSGSAPAIGGINATFMSDPLLNEWTNQGRATLNPAILKQVYDETQSRAIQLATVVPIYTPASIVGATASVKGLSFDPDSWLVFYDAWLAS
jgi:peptide/nickel transport system substrate-binding protein